MCTRDGQVLNRLIHVLARIQKKCQESQSQKCFSVLGINKQSYSINLVPWSLQMSISHVLCRCFTLTLVISWTTKRRNLGSTERGFPLSWLRTLCESLSEAQTKHPNTNSSESKSVYHSFTEDLINAELNKIFSSFFCFFYVWSVSVLTFHH